MDLFSPNFWIERFRGVNDVLVALVDVLLVTFLLYRLLMLVRGTRAWRILLGLSIFGIVYALSGPASLNLRTLHWMLDKATPLGPVALVILFLPELRQAIEGMGRLGFQLQHFGEGGADRLAAHTIEEIVSAVTELATAQSSLGRRCGGSWRIRPPKASAVPTTRRWKGSEGTWS